LILLTCGVSGNTIRLLFPLVITDELFEAGLNMLEESLSGVASGEGLRR
jgi:4-aminobutyrate aminotransferase-like enzyme